CASLAHFARGRAEEAQLEAALRTGASFDVLASFADAESVGDAVDVVEPARDQVDLQDAAVVKAGVAQMAQVRGWHARGLCGRLGGVVEHGASGRREIRFCVIAPQRGA